MHVAASSVVRVDRDHGTLARRASFYPRSKQWRHAVAGALGESAGAGRHLSVGARTAPGATSRLAPRPGMLAAVRALPPASRWHLGRRADARRRVDAPIAPQGIENPREAPRKGHDRPQLAAPL